MKLASLKGGRDGRLVVVTNDLAWCAPADRIAPSLQAALDDWERCDLEAEVAVIVGDVPMGASREEALAAIRLVMLCNDVSLRNLIPGELAKGFGFFQSKPASSFSPVAV